MYMYHIVRVDQFTISKPYLMLYNNFIQVVDIHRLIRNKYVKQIYIYFLQIFIFFLVKKVFRLIV